MLNFQCCHSYVYLQERGGTRKGQVERERGREGEREGGRGVKGEERKGCLKIVRCTTHLAYSSGY